MVSFETETLDDCSVLRSVVLLVELRGAPSCDPGGFIRVFAGWLVDGYPQFHSRCTSKSSSLTASQVQSYLFAHPLKTPPRYRLLTREARKAKTHPPLPTSLAQLRAIATNMFSSFKRFSSSISPSDPTDAMP